MKESRVVHTNAARLREMIAKRIWRYIDMHRESRRYLDEQYDAPTGPPTDDEINDFLASNPMFDSDTVEQLSDEGFLGFEANKVSASVAWLREFKEAIQAWADNQTWLAADEPWLNVVATISTPQTELWTPTSIGKPQWVDASPSALLLAADLLKSGRSLCDLHWREFERLIGDLLERKGWKVEVMRGSKDGGVDVIADIKDPVLGYLRAVWQAKKYAQSRKVGLSEVRELSAVRVEHGATKGVIVTTSRLTRGAIDWIKRDIYALEYKDGTQVESWIRDTAWGGSEESK